MRLPHFAFLGLDGGLEGTGVPKVNGVSGLDVVVAVEEDVRAGGARVAAGGPDDGVAAAAGTPMSRSSTVKPDSRRWAAAHSAAARVCSLYAGSVEMLGILSQSMRRAMEFFSSRLSHSRTASTPGMGRLQSSIDASVRRGRGTEGYRRGGMKSPREVRGLELRM